MKAFWIAIASFILVVACMSPAFATGNMGGCPGGDCGGGSQQPVSSYTQTTITFTSEPASSEPPAGPSCPSRLSENLVPDPQYLPECVYMCKAGYKFDENGNCVKASPVATPATNTQTQGLVTPDGKEIKPGDKIKIYPKEKIELGAKCREFVSLVRGSMDNPNEDFRKAIPKMGVWMGRFDWGGSETGIGLSDGSIMQLMRCVHICAKLYEEDPNLLHIQSASQIPIKLGSLRNTDTSGPAAQIGLKLESGPFLAEVVNNDTSLDIDTGTMTVSSLGNNTFGVAYDPTNSVSFVIAYKQPVNITPKNSSLTPFKLNRSQAVAIDAKSVSQIVPLESLLNDTASNEYGSSDTSSDQSSGQSSIDQSPAEPTNNVQKLKQLKSMLDAGLITQNDYNSTKARILSWI